MPVLEKTRLPQGGVRDNPARKEISQHVAVLHPVTDAHHGRGISTSGDVSSLRYWECVHELFTSCSGISKASMFGQSGWVILQSLSRLKKSTHQNQNNNSRQESTLKEASLHCWSGCHMLPLKLGVNAARRRELPSSELPQGIFRLRKSLKSLPWNHLSFNKETLGSFVSLLKGQLPF